MKLEIDSACNFIIFLIKLECPFLSEAKHQKLWNNLNKIMIRKYKNHWFTDKPNKSSAFRCLRCYDTYLDCIIQEACQLSKISEKIIHKYLPTELILWIDPGEVYYRVGNGYMYVLYPNKDKKTWNFKDNHSLSKTFQPLSFLKVCNYIVKINKCFEIDFNKNKIKNLVMWFFSTNMGKYVSLKRTLVFLRDVGFYRILF